MKRFIYLLLLLGALVGIFFLFFNKGTQNGTPSGNSVFKNFFSRDENAGGEDNQTNGSPVDETIVLPNLPETSTFTPISTFPVAGYITFNKTRTLTSLSSDNKPTVSTVTEPVIRFVSRFNGYVYETLDGKTATQISNVFIPNIYEALFSKNGSFALVRFLRDDGRTIATYSVPVPELNSDGTRTQIPGVYFPDEITAIAIDPNREHIVFVQKIESGVSIKDTTFDYKKQKEVLKHDFESWIPLLSTKQTYLQTKSSGFADGFLYTLGEKSSVLKKILGDAQGLTTSISPQGNFILYSESVRDGFVAKILSLKDGAITPLSIKVLPEKCVWLQNEDLICAKPTSIDVGVYPDIWYAGTTSFIDTFVKIYTKNGSYNPLLETPPFSFDATNLSVDESKNLLYFIDKKTGILWSYNYR